MKLEGKTALVTGGSEGLGFEIAKLLLEEEMKVAICGRNNDKLAAAKEKLASENLSTYQCDVSDVDDVQQTIAEIGGIDVLINNAGIWLEGNLEEHDPVKVSNVIDVNLKGVIYTTQAALPFMKDKNNGFIFNIASTAGTEAKKNSAVYVASKWGVRGFSDSLAKDLEDTNIKVAGFYPGGMSTSLFAKAGNPKQNDSWMPASEVAQVVVFILKRPDSMIIDTAIVRKRPNIKAN